MMPGLDGFEVCRIIKNDPATSGIKVIMVTAKTSGKDIETGLSAGADYYITKPFKISELSEKIKELIG
jgi:DNA-binding response OmpR family regulator